MRILYKKIKVFSTKYLYFLFDFPNDTTRICPELLERLKKLMGEETWRVEEITFQ
ncbi:MAG: hypothetical protein J0M11_21520 [Anaerolineae bacterium]|nr:hypothetical protein [Anaerolineae bacterium]